MSHKRAKIITALAAFSLLSGILMSVLTARYRIVAAYYAPFGCPGIQKTSGTPAQTQKTLPVGTLTLSGDERY